MICFKTDLPVPCLSRSLFLFILFIFPLSLKSPINGWVSFMPVPKMNLARSLRANACISSSWSLFLSPLFTYEILSRQKKRFFTGQIFSCPHARVVVGTWNMRTHFGTFALVLVNCNALHISLCILSRAMAKKVLSYIAISSNDHFAQLAAG